MVRSACAFLLALHLAGMASAQSLHKCVDARGRIRSEEHTSELQSRIRISYAVFCLKKKKKKKNKKLKIKIYFCFFFNDPAPPEFYTNLNTLSLHDALPI